MAHRSKYEIMKSLNSLGLDEFNFISCHLSELESEADVRETLEVCLDTIQIYSQMVGELRKILHLMNNPTHSEKKTDKEIIEFFRTVFNLTYHSEEDNYHNTRNMIND